MRLATLGQLRKAAANVASRETWNNTDANFLRNQTVLIQDRLEALQQPMCLSSSDKTWANYERKHDALTEKLLVCDREG